MAKLKDLVKENFSLVGGVVSTPAINQGYSSLSKIVKEKYGESSEAQKVSSKQVKEALQNYNKLGETLYQQQSLKETAKSLSQIAEMAATHTVQETEDWFDKVTINKNMKSLGNTSGEFTKIAKEANALQQRMESLYEDMGHILGRYYDLDEAMDKVDPSKVEPEDDYEDRDDKDIDNDGDTDDSDRYLHKRRQAISKAIKNKK